MSETAAARARRDQRTADDAATEDRTLLCSAHGCPNRWSVDAGGGRLCSAHAWVSPSRWPQVTDEQLDAQTQRALDAMQPAPPQAARARIDPREVAGKFSQFRMAQPGRQWAVSLKHRDEAGERLTQTQRAMYREALRMPAAVAGELDDDRRAA